MRNILATLVMMLASITSFSQVTTDTTLTESKAKARELEEVVVKAQIPPFRPTKGGLVSQIQGTALSNAGSCFDVLLQMPGVRNDEGTIEIIGKGIPLIYINGRKMIDRSELDRLPSKDILSIELLTNPGAKYSAEVKSVILVKTIRKRGDGLSGTVSTTNRAARFFSQADNVFLNYRTGGIDIFGSFDYDYSQRYQNQRNHTIIAEGKDCYTIDSKTFIYPKNISYLGNAGINWQINNNHSVGARYECSSTPYSKSRWNTHENVDLNHKRIETIDYITLWNGERLPTHSTNLYYLGKIGKFTIDINNDYYYQRNKNTQSIEETSTQTGNKDIKSDSGIKSQLFASKGTATYNWSRNELEFGYEFFSTDRHDIFTNSTWIAQEELPNSNDRIKENTIAAFLSINIPFRGVEFGAGVRYERTHSNYFENGMIVTEQSRKYSRLYPNFDFTFPVGKARFTLYYSAKTKRPLYSQLSSAIQYDDKFTYETGNPLLTSELIHDVSLAGIYKWIFFSASYQYDKDAIVSIIKPYGENSPANLMTYGNYNHISKYSVVFSVSPTIKRWSPRLRLNLLGQHFRLSTIGGAQRMDNPILFWSLYNNLSLGKGFGLNGDIIGRTRGDMDVVTIKPSWQINMGITKNIRNIFMQLQATDIFKTARNSMISYGDRMALDKWNYSDSRALRLMIRYSFNTTLSKYKGKSAGLSERQRL